MKDHSLKIDEKVRHHQHQHRGRFTLLALFSPGCNGNKELDFKVSPIPVGDKSQVSRKIF